MQTLRFPDLPAHMASLRTDHRGFPVPWFVAWVDGEPQFPVVDPAKIVLAVKGERCWICGGKLGRFRASVSGPMCAVNRTISEPQSHVACARFAAINCPFLAKPNMGRVPHDKIPAGVVEPAGGGLKRNPGACAVWIETRATKPFNPPGGGVLFELGEPHLVEWYAKGRRADRQEVMHSIETGMPLLLEAIAQEITQARRHEALEFLHAQLARAALLLPPVQAEVVQLDGVEP